MFLTRNKKIIQGLKIVRTHWKCPIESVSISTTAKKYLSNKADITIQGGLSRGYCLDTLHGCLNTLYRYSDRM